MSQSKRSSLSVVQTWEFRKNIFSYAKLWLERVAQNFSDGFPHQETVIVTDLMDSVALNKGYITISFRFSLLNNFIQMTMDFLWSFLWLFSCISGTWRNVIFNLTTTYQKYTCLNPCVTWTSGYSIKWFLILCLWLTHSLLLFPLKDSESIMNIY